MVCMCVWGGVGVGVGVCVGVCGWVGEWVGVGGWVCKDSMSGVGG